MVLLRLPASPGVVALAVVVALGCLAPPASGQQGAPTTPSPIRHPDGTTTPLAVWFGVALGSWMLLIGIYLFARACQGPEKASSLFFCPVCCATCACCSCHNDCHSVAQSIEDCMPESCRGNKPCTQKCIDCCGGSACCDCRECQDGCNQCCSECKAPTCNCQNCANCQGCRECCADCTCQNVCPECDDCCRDCYQNCFAGCGDCCAGTEASCGNCCGCECEAPQCEEVACLCCTLRCNTAPP